MIKVLVKTNMTRKEVIVNDADTPKSVFDNIGIGTADNKVSMTCSSFSDGAITLSNGDLNKSFSSLNVKEGDSVTLYNIVKMDNANK